MGLDITVYKPIALGKRDPKKFGENIPDGYNIYVIDESPELVKFKRLSFNMKNEYYDLEKGFKQKGLNFKEWGNYWRSTGSRFKDPQLQKDWEKRADGSFDGKDFNASDMVMVYTFEKNGKRLEIVDPPKLSKTEKCILVKEVGYQRKGANKKFYEDEMWDSTKCVVNKKTLTQHWKKYFSHQTPDSKGGFGSGVEHDVTNAEMKRDFKKNIMDKFIEGKTFVIYH